MPAFAALLFDLDGTLCDTAADLAASVNWARAELGAPPLDEARITRSVGNGLTRLMERSIADIPDADLQASIALFRTHYAEHCVDATRAYEGIVPALDALAAIPKAVVTNKPERFSATILARLGLLRHFRALVGGDTCHAKKPDPAPVRLALDLLHIPAGAAAAIVGDGDTDIAAGRAARLTTCGVAWGLGDRERLLAERPHLLAETPADLVRLFGA